MLMTVILWWSDVAVLTRAHKSHGKLSLWHQQFPASLDILQCMLYVSRRNVIHEWERKNEWLKERECLRVLLKFRDLTNLCESMDVYPSAGKLLWCIMNTLNHFKTIQLNKLKTKDSSLICSFFKYKICTYIIVLFWKKFCEKNSNIVKYYYNLKYNN